MNGRLRKVVIPFVLILLVFSMVPTTAGAA
jgi:hypothetical protein